MSERDIINRYTALGSEKEDYLQPKQITEMGMVEPYEEGYASPVSGDTYYDRAGNTWQYQKDVEGNLNLVLVEIDNEEYSRWENINRRLMKNGGRIRVKSKLGNKK